MSSSSRPKEDEEMAVLESTISSLLSLLTQFESSLTSSSAAPSAENKVDPLTAVEQSASLIKAQTTKLSLLCITDPFTPSAIRTVLRELSTGALPVLMSAVQSCVTASWGVTFTNELQSRTKRLLQQLRTLLVEVTPQRKRAGDSSQIITGETPTKKDDLRSTGVIWETCDELIDLGKKGIAGVLATKAQQYRDMLEDAVTELREWGEEVVEDESEDDDDDDDDEEWNEGLADGAKDDVNIFLQPNKGLRKKDTELKSQLESTLKRLELVKMLYKPLIKRRLRTFPAPASATATALINGGDTVEKRPERIAKLETLMRNLKTIQEQTDELASAFYDHNSEQARELLERCVALAKESASAVQLNWKNETDELSPWLEKWKDVIGR